jgi:hypothetical protein
MLVGKEGNILIVRDADTDQRVVVDTNTVLVGDPQIGDQILVMWTSKGDVYLATLITVTHKAGATPEPMDFTGAIERIEGEWWTVSSDTFRITFRVTGNTEIDGEPGLDRQAEVDAERRADGEIWARKVVVRSLPGHDLQGMIEVVSTNYIVLRGSVVQTIYFNDRTQFAGDPPMVDRWTETRVMVLPDGRLLARTLMVHAPTPAPTATETPTPRPTRAPTATPTATAPASPTPTATQPRPTATATASHTSRPTATASHTPRPTATASHTPRPTATASHTPPPTATPTATLTKTAGGTR